MPNGNLEIARDYACGCRVYRDQDGQEWTELGLFCEPELHKEKRRTKGEPEPIPLPL